MVLPKEWRPESRLVPNFPVFLFVGVNLRSRNSKSLRPFGLGLTVRNELNGIKVHNFETLLVLFATFFCCSFLER